MAEFAIGRTVDGTEFGIPAVPSNLMVTPASSTEIVLTWDRNSTDETSLVIERKTGSGGSYLTLSTRSAGSNLSLPIPVVTRRRPISIVSAENAFGASAPCEERAATTPKSTATLPLAADFTFTGSGMRIKLVSTRTLQREAQQDNGKMPHNMRRRPYCTLASKVRRSAWTLEAD